MSIEQKANSEDGIVINHLWEKIGEGSFALWNNPHFYVLTKEKKSEEEDDWVSVPLTTTKMAEELKWTTRTVRKVINSLSLCAKGLPPLVKVGPKPYRVIFFDPEKMEKRLREFVVDYEPRKILKLAKEKLGGAGQQKLPVENEVTEVTQVTDKIHGNDQGGREKTEKNDDIPCAGSVTSVTSVTEKIAIACGSCEFFHAKNCVHEKPELIQRTATYASSCKNYRGKSA